MKLTTTEQYLLASAFEKFGDDNLNKISEYLNLNNIHISLNEIVEHYRCLKERSLSEGYSSVTKYAKDVRYVKALEYYKKYKEMLYDVLENKIDLDKLVIPMDEPFYLGQLTTFNTINNKNNEEEKDISSYCVMESQYEYSKADQQLQIEPQSLNKSQIKMRIDSPKNLKEKKRYYMRLDEEEQLIDDYFDYLDLKQGDGKKDPKNIMKRNEFFRKYPIMNRNEHVTDNVENIKTQFENIMNKVICNKKHEKDKSLWRMELKVIIEFMIHVFGKKDKFLEVMNNIENNNLQHTVMSLILIIQDMIIDEKNGTRLEKYNAIQKELTAFCEYYKN